MDWNRLVSKGDTEKQAVLKDSMIKKGKAGRSVYVSEILSVLKPTMKVLDVGCGTAHIIQELAENSKSSKHVGLDVSKAMLKVPKENCKETPQYRIGYGRRIELAFS